MDALAGAVGYWVEQMGMDQALAHTAHLESLRDEALAEFAKHVIGRREPSANGWGDTPHRW